MGGEKFGDRFRRKQAEVTSLPSQNLRRPGSLLTEIESYWRELLKRSGDVPRRADLEASRIAGALPHTFILECVAGIGRFRLGGQSINALLGADPKGVPMSVLFTPEARPQVQSWLDRCLSAPALVDLGVSASQKALRAPLKGRLLLLPLRDADGAVTRVLGGLLLDGAAPRSGPLRFDLSNEATRWEPVGAPAAPGRFGLAPGSGSGGFAEAERPYLRLVVSNG